MAAKFLDAAGLRYVITKIKALINDKQDKLTFGHDANKRQ